LLLFYVVILLAVLKYMHNVRMVRASGKIDEATPRTGKEVERIRQLEIMWDTECVSCV